jgi:hypothetical protein
MKKLNSMKIEKLSHFSQLLLVLMLISTFLYKPTVLGINYTPVGMCLSLICCILFLFFNKQRITISKKNMAVMLAILTYFIYVCSQSIILLGWLDTNLVKAFISIISLLLCFSIVFQDKLIEYYFFKLFIAILILFVVSNIFTLIFAKIFSLEQILLFDIAMMEDGYRLHVYFPFTPVWGRLNIFGELIMRLSALFRESGIAQAFYLWAFVVCGKYYQSKYLKYLLLLGVIMNLSTVGFLNLMVILGLITILNIKLNKLSTPLLSLLLLVGAFGVFSSIPGINLESKSSVSYDARVGKLDEGSNEFLKSPIFGSGASDIYIEGTATSFLQQSYAVGVVGVILYLFIFVIGFIWEEGSKKDYFIAYVPVMITLLFSQPIETAPLVMFLLLVDFNNKYLNQT